MMYRTALLWMLLSGACSNATATLDSPSRQAPLDFANGEINLHGNLWIPSGDAPHYAGANHMIMKDSRIDSAYLKDMVSWTIANVH